MSYERETPLDTIFVRLPSAIACWGTVAVAAQIAVRTDKEWAKGACVLLFMASPFLGAAAAMPGLLLLHPIETTRRWRYVIKEKRK